MNYNVRSLGKKCCATGQRLEPGSRCFSALVLKEGQTIRLDFNEAGWEGPPEGTVAWWRVDVPDATLRPQQLDPDSLMSCFEQLTEEANPSRDQLRYVLALLLLKQRRLEIDGTREEDERIYLQVIGSHSEGPYEVLDYGLPEEEIQTLQQQLMTIMLYEEEDEPETDLSSEAAPEFTIPDS